MSDKKVIVIISEETLIQSIISDMVTLAMIAACVWISGDSTLWQVVCLGFFLVYLSSRSGSLFSEKFDSIDGAIFYLKGKKKKK